MINAKCKISGEAFEVDDAELEFLERVSPVFAGQKSLLPPPNIAPEERSRRRRAFRNLRSLYRRSCDLTGRTIITPYSPDSPHTVYHSDDWWSDKWDGLAYGRDFDFNRPFFDQFAELYRSVPLVHHYVTHSENCEYINGAAHCRDCYLSFDMDYCEKCLYLTSAKHCLSCVDSIGLTRCELCYECIDCTNCYNVAFSSRCVGCYDSYFLKECRQCKNCIGCSNLHNKEYYVFNEKKSPEEFEAIRAKLRNRNEAQKLWAQAQQHHLKFPRKAFFGHSNEGFSGDNLHHVKNSYDCFDCFELENCRYCSYVFQAANCMDHTVFGDSSEWIYNCQGTGLNCTFDICCNFCWSGSSNNLYCHLVSACSNCFGCSGLKNKSYCIFNKQYSKAEYEQLVPRIIEHMRATGEWGEFFPPSMSPFGFNETIAFEEQPLPREEAERRGYRWTAGPEKKVATEQIIIPDSIDDVDDSITKAELRCARSSEAYRITPQELKFYRDMGLPLPDACPDARHAERIERRNSRKLWKRTCDKTGEEIWTTYAPDGGDIVYSENAYLAEVV